MMEVAPGPLPSVAIVLLAAGKASRMGEGGPHKLLATFDGVPLVRRMAERALATGVPTIVVTGHRHGDIALALAGLDVALVHNADYASGLAGSIITGFEAAAADRFDGVLILLADMPLLTTSDLRALIDAFSVASGQVIVRAMSNGKRGNPVILPISLRTALLSLSGDAGAREIVETCGLPVVDVEIGDAARLDVDTPEAVIAAGGILGD